MSADAAAPEADDVGASAADAGSKPVRVQVATVPAGAHVLQIGEPATLLRTEPASAWQAAEAAEQGASAGQAARRAGRYGEDRAGATGCVDASQAQSEAGEQA